MPGDGGGRGERHEGGIWFIQGHRKPPGDDDCVLCLKLTVSQVYKYVQTHQPVDLKHVVYCMTTVPQ